MLVKDQMTPEPVTVSPTTPVGEAQKLMQERDIRHLPVLDDEGQVTGLITRAALLRAIPWSTYALSNFETRYILSKTEVCEVMVKEVVTVGEDVAVEEAARIMVDRKIGCLPVLREGHMVGIITDVDLLSISMELLGARQQGVRVTLSFPDRPGQLARITTAIADVGGNLAAAGAWPTREPNVWSTMIKVTNLPRDQVLEILDELQDVQILDVRET